MLKASPLTRHAESGLYGAQRLFYFSPTPTVRKKKKEEATNRLGEDTRGAPPPPHSTSFPPRVFSTTLPNREEKVTHRSPYRYQDAAGCETRRGGENTLCVFFFSLSFLFSPSECLVSTSYFFLHPSLFLLLFFFYSTLRSPHSCTPCLRIFWAAAKKRNEVSHILKQAVFFFACTCPAK